MKKIKWISEPVVHAIHNRQIAEHGGLAGVRDENLLKSALNNPLNRYHYSEDPKPTAVMLAANYAYSICKNHPFLDANKRTALVVCELFLVLNELIVLADPLEKYQTYIQLAAGELSEAEFCDWLDKVSDDFESK